MLLDPQTADNREHAFGAVSRPEDVGEVKLAKLGPTGEGKRSVSRPSTVRKAHGSVGGKHDGADGAATRERARDDESGELLPH
jgi:hypothetical protein